MSPRQAWPSITPKTGGLPQRLAVPAPGVVNVYPSWYSVDNRSGSVVVAWDGTFVSTTGTTTAGIQEAIDYLVAAGRGGVVQLFAGEYEIRPKPNGFGVELNGSDIELRGVGPATILTNSSRSSNTFSQGIVEASASRTAVRCLKIVYTSYASAFGYCMTFNMPDGTAIEDVLFADLHLEQQGSNGWGFSMRNSASSGGTIDRVTFRDCVIEHSGDDATWTGTDDVAYGLGLSVRNGTGSELVIDNVRVIGAWINGVNTNSNTGGKWQRSKISRLFVKDALRRGARFYHCGESTIADSEFRDCDVGAFFDSGSSNQGWRVDSCRFINNAVVGAYMEEWEHSSISNTLFTGNGRGLWVSAGRYCSFDGILAFANTNEGITVDAKETMAANFGADYSITNRNSIQDLTFSGCQCIRNGTHGLELLGVLRSCSVTGGTYSRNGTGTGSSSGHAGIHIGQDTTGTATSRVAITGAAFCNSAASPAESSQNYGILVDAGGAGGTIVVGNYFETIDEPLRMQAGEKVIVGNLFVSCNTITMSDPKTMGLNRINGGSLDEGTWDRRYESDDGPFTIAGSRVDIDENLRVLGGVSTAIRTVAANSSINATDDRIILCDLSVTSGAISLTLPGSPFDGMSLIFRDINGAAATYNVTLLRNAKNIEGAASDQVLSTNDFAVEYIYDDNSGSWWLVSGTP